MPGDDDSKKTNAVRPALFVELCAGLASVSLMLQHGQGVRPPISRMGNKHGYALAILRVLGLRPGQRASRYLWCEPDAGCRALLHAYTDPELMRAAAAQIREWDKCPHGHRAGEDTRLDNDEFEACGFAHRDDTFCPECSTRDNPISTGKQDPRRLWERLRGMGPIRDGEGAARMALLSSWSYEAGNIKTGFAGPEDRRKTRAALISLCDAHAEATELARWLQVQASNRLIHIDSGTMRNAGQGGTTFGGSEFATPAAVVSERTAEAPSGFPADIVDDCRPLRIEGDHSDTIVYADVPYRNTTGYGHALPREEWLPLARAWADAGATVCISEAEPIEELAGWHTVEITDCRKGQKRTFSKQKREWLTLSRKPAWVPAVQVGLFG